MKKNFTLFLLILSSIVFSQIKIKKGLAIDDIKIGDSINLALTKINQKALKIQTKKDLLQSLKFENDKDKEYSFYHMIEFEEKYYFKINDYGINSITTLKGIITSIEITNKKTDNLKNYLILENTRPFLNSFNYCASTLNDKYHASEFYSKKEFTSIKMNSFYKQGISFKLIDDKITSLFIFEPINNKITGLSTNKYKKQVDYDKIFEPGIYATYLGENHLKNQAEVPAYSIYSSNGKGQYILIGSNQEYLLEFESCKWDVNGDILRNSGFKSIYLTPDLETKKSTISESGQFVQEWKIVNYEDNIFELRCIRYIYTNGEIENYEINSPDWQPFYLKKVGETK